ncbi:MAG: type 1 glutamine amidotransferase [Candidatus Kuenenia sp.]|nr:type 1 glutamine amidotransferase [Candidatus Kuenenia hertensis]
MILFIKHIDIEGPGTIEDFLEDNKVPYIITDLSNKDKLPELKKNFQMVVSLGGPMNVYEEEKYPFLAEENILLKEVVKRDMPFLGVCLGSQLIVKAIGGTVSKNPLKEIGFYKVTINEDGLKDDLFKNFSGEITVYQWHGDTFSIPEGGKRLATSELCENQTVKYGRNIYGVQFHIEVTRNMIAEWADAYNGELESLKGVVSDKQKMLEDYDNLKGAYLKQAERFYVNLFSAANLLKKKSYSVP